jgi:hypothetical protein
MNAKAKKQRDLITSADLSAYPLPKRLKSVLAEFDAMQEWGTKGHHPLKVVRLFKEQWVDINSEIVKWSNGRRSLNEVTYRGLPVIHPQMEARHESNP